MRFAALSQCGSDLTALIKCSEHDKRQDLIRSQRQSNPAIVEYPPTNSDAK